jgi:N-acetylmuramate 1-kinase
MIDRGAARQALLLAAGWGDAVTTFLAGDASDRRYERLKRGAETAVLMDAPPGKGDDPAMFVAVAAHLLGIGLSAPRLLAEDTENGFLLLEDFGDAVFARIVANDAQLEPTLYDSAIDALVQLQTAAPMSGIPALSCADWAQAAALVLSEYRFGVSGEPCDPLRFLNCLSALIDQQSSQPTVMILRDFHAENLIWLPDRIGAARAGLLDFQLAQMGHPAYDVVSLLQDARRDVSQQTALRASRSFCDLTGMSWQSFDSAAAVWGTQRALRILGVFARLARQSGKTSYIRLIPRVWGHLQTNLAHATLAEFKRICDVLLPLPNAAVLAKLSSKDGR